MKRVLSSNRRVGRSSPHFILRSKARWRTVSSSSFVHSCVVIKSRPRKLVFIVVAPCATRGNTAEIWDQDIPHSPNGVRKGMSWLPLVETCSLIQRYCPQGAPLHVVHRFKSAVGRA